MSLVILLVVSLGLIVLFFFLTGCMPFLASSCVASFEVASMTMFEASAGNPFLSLVVLRPFVNGYFLWRRH